MLRTRAIDLLSLLIKLPIILWRFPGNLKDRMKVSRELRLKRRISKKRRAKEIKVLNLIAQGKINKEIAQELFMSEQTVKTHLNHIFQKLEVSNRTQAVVKGINRGLVSSEGGEEKRGEE